MMYRTTMLILICWFAGNAVAQKAQPIPPGMSSFINHPLFHNAHLGVAIFDPADGKYLLDYQSEKLFVPASNVKIATCYVSMKYLSSRLPGIRYLENDTAVYLLPTGDPTLLHRDFKEQPVIRFLQDQPKKIFLSMTGWDDHELGKGWSWDDFSDEYMTEKNALPVYGNTIRWVQEKIPDNELGPELSMSVYSDPEVTWRVRFDSDPEIKKFNVKREKNDNVFIIYEGPEPFKEVFVPFVVKGVESSLLLLKDTVRRDIPLAGDFLVNDPQPEVIWSQPLDSVLRPMMYRSDNFFAEQLLLMVAAERNRIMNVETLIDTVLATDLNDLPQQPVWVDGSGLSRYNLFSPRALVAVLQKIQNEFGIDRARSIFPAGDSGTLKHYYTDGTPYIYAKTGSMSGVLALSGYLYTRTNRQLIFSVMINNYTGNSSQGRRRIEQFLKSVRSKY